jgi:hypothetical protein
MNSPTRERHLASGSRFLVGSATAASRVTKVDRPDTGGHQARSTTTVAVDQRQVQQVWLSRDGQDDHAHALHGILCRSWRCRPLRAPGAPSARPDRHRSGQWHPRKSPFVGRSAPLIRGAAVAPAPGTYGATRRGAPHRQLATTNKSIAGSSANGKGNLSTATVVGECCGTSHDARAAAVR